jgi:GTPase
MSNFAKFMSTNTQTLHKTAKKQETAVLIGVDHPSQEGRLGEYLEELEALVQTAGAETVQVFTQNLAFPNPKTYVGKGKLETIATWVAAHKVDFAVFDDELTPSQIRNIEAELPEVKVLSRTNLILDIFAANAKTAQAKTQVELAQSIYLLPRLTRLWTHLSKQKGGIGMKGPGETEIETDRRILRDKISALRERLKHIELVSITQRKNRAGMARVALVGYTNVGKSTVMNALTKADVLVENKLFATLDSTVRKLVLPVPGHDYENIPLLLSDTVGFIRKLPTLLVESFKSTLAEAVEADLLLHVVDISNPNFEDQVKAVNDTLLEIGAGNKPVIMVFNKIDAFRAAPDDFFIGHTGLTAAQFEKSWLASSNAPAVFISATEKDNLETLRIAIANWILHPKQ